jgi:hypothetical protein
MSACDNLLIIVLMLFLIFGIINCGKIKRESFTSCLNGPSKQILSNPPKDTTTIPYGADRTMITSSNPYGCLSNVNGVNKPEYINDYGIADDNGQFYGYCVKGIDNAFNDNKVIGDFNVF